MLLRAAIDLYDLASVFKDFKIELEPRLLIPEFVVANQVPAVAPRPFHDSCIVMNVYVLYLRSKEDVETHSFKKWHQECVHVSVEQQPL